MANYLVVNLRDFKLFNEALLKEYHKLLKELNLIL